MHSAVYMRLSVVYTLRQTELLLSINLSRSMHTDWIVCLMPLNS